MPTLYSRTGHTQLDKAVPSQPVSVAETVESAPVQASTVTPDISAVPEVQEVPEVPENEADATPDVASQQTQFAEDLTIEGMSAATLPSLQSDAVVPAPKRLKWTFIGLGLALVVIMTIGVLLPRSEQAGQNTAPTPPPSTEEERELSALQRELILLEKDIEQADPLQAKLAFPPVNFELILEDATTLDQNQRSPLR